MEGIQKQKDKNPISLSVVAKFMKARWRYLCMLAQHSLVNKDLLKNDRIAN